MDSNFVIDYSLQTKCEICGMGDFEDQVLLCDGLNCNRECHMFCLRPIITEVPEGAWLCPLCSDKGNLISLSLSLQKKETTKRRKDLNKEIKESENVDQNYQDRLSNFIDLENESIIMASKCVGMLVKVFSENDRTFHTGRILRMKLDSDNGQPLHLVQFQR